MAPERIVDISLTEMNKRLQPKEPTLEEILTDCCLVFNEPIAMVRSGIRKRELVNVRRINSYVALQLTNSTLQKIADTVGLSNHTSVLAHLSQIKSFLHSRDSIFLGNWNKYVATSKIWSKYVK